MQIIPAIDIINGKCVRLTQGDYSRKTVYSEDPLEVAKAFESAGILRLHLVDLDGAKAGAVQNWKVLQNIATNTKLIIDFGGGIKTEDDLLRVFDSGAALATIGSVAVKAKQLFTGWLDKYGANKFFLGADVKNEMIAVSGWEETSDENIFSFLENYHQIGVQDVFCTDVSKDGLLAGPSVDLYRQILQKLPALHLVASGGVRDLADLEELQQIGCTGAIVGKAFYEGHISLSQMASFNS